MEKFDAKELRKNTYFNIFLLGGELKGLTECPDWDSSEMTIELKINGISVRVEDFNRVLEGWSGRLEGQIKSKLAYLSKEQSVNDNAKVLLEEKLGKAYSILQDIEDSKWVLDYS